MSEWAGKGFKAVILIVFFMFKKLKRASDKKKNHIKLLEIKNARSEKNRWDTTEQQQQQWTWET